MKIPRDLNSTDLIKLLKDLGYFSTRQSGSHIRLTTTQNGEHHITITNHKPLKIGTLNVIIADVANHLNLGKESLLLKLFG